MLNPSVIHYIALLDNRQSMPFTNVPPSTIVHPMLRYIGNLPQHMLHFIYGCEYYELIQREGLQMGYNLIFFHPDTISSISTIGYNHNDVYIFLVCTESSTCREHYAKKIASYTGDNTLTIVGRGSKQIGGLPGAIADNSKDVWDWLYTYAVSHYEIDYSRSPFSVPFFKNKGFYDTGNVFTPSRVNTQIFNSVLGNWGYESSLSEKKRIELEAESSNAAFKNKQGFDRQKILLDQIANLHAIEHQVAGNVGKIDDFEDQFFPPLIIAAPYNSIEMRKPIDINTIHGYGERKAAEMLNAVMNFNYTPNYTVDITPDDIPEGNFVLYSAIQREYVLPRMVFTDIVGLLHSSIRFSPYLRLPVLGKNINSELAFVGIKGVDKLTEGKKAKRNIRKVMERIGKKIADCAMSPTCQKMIHVRASQIVAMTDLPIEWTLTDGVPLAFSHDVCRLPETPIPSLLTQYEENIFTPFTVSKDILKKTLVVFCNTEEAFKAEQQRVIDLSKHLGFQIKTCLSVESFEQALYEVKPSFLIIDTHGDVDEATHQSYLWLGEEKLTGDIVVNKHLSAPIVFLSACKTFTTGNTIATIANAFFEAGAQTVTTSYMPISIKEATWLYARLLRLLHDASNMSIHKNWLAFMSHLQRTSYIQALVTEAKTNKAKDIKDSDLAELIGLQTESMQFRKRRAIYKKLNDTNLAKRMGVDLENVIPHYLMYSTIGRADLIQFDSYLEKRHAQYIKTPTNQVND